jgi:hypothetical protein
MLCTQHQRVACSIQNASEQRMRGGRVRYLLAHGRNVYRGHINPYVTEVPNIPNVAVEYSYSSGPKPESLSIFSEVRM